MQLTKALSLGILLAFSCSPIVARAQDAPVPLIPETLPQAVRNELAVVRTPLVARVDAYNQKVDAFNSACGHIQPTDSALIASCTQKFQAMSAEGAALENDKKRFAAQLNVAVTAPNPVPAGSPSPACPGGGSTSFFGSPGNPSNPDLDCSPPTRPVRVNSTLDQASSAANSGTAASSDGISKEAAATEANCAFGTAACAAYTPVHIDKTVGQTPGAVELASHIPDKAKNDPVIQAGLAYYEKMDGRKIDTKSKLEAIQKQIDSGTGDAKVLAAQQSTLSNDLKYYTGAEATTKAQIKEQLKSTNMAWDESPAPGAAAPAKKTP